MRKMFLFPMVITLVTFVSLTNCYASGKYHRLNILPRIYKGDVTVTSIGKDWLPEQGNILAEVNVDQHMVEFRCSRDGFNGLGLVDYYDTSGSYYGFEWLTQAFMRVDVVVLPGGRRQNAFVMVRSLSLGLAYRIMLDADMKKIIIERVDDAGFSGQDETYEGQRNESWSMDYNIKPYEVYRIYAEYIKDNPNRIWIWKLSTSSLGIPSIEIIVRKTYEEMGLTPLVGPPFGFHVGTRASAARFFNEELKIWIEE